MTKTTIATWKIFAKPGEDQISTIVRLAKELAKEKKKAGK